MNEVEKSEIEKNNKNKNDNENFSNQEDESSVLPVSIKIKNRKAFSKKIEEEFTKDIKKDEEKEKKKIERLRKRKFKLAQMFCDAVVKKYKKFIKAVVIFGSVVRGDLTEKSDIDILVIIDDTIARFTPEMREAFDIKLYDLAKSISEDISVQPAWTLTEFWDMARIGHPLLYTIVRDGWALYDAGFFVPVRKLLERGKIPHTIEAVELLIESAPKKIARVENVKLYMVAEDLYYAMLNASQAVLMYLGKESPRPKEAVKNVREYLLSNKLIEKKYVDYLEKIIKFRKDVEHKKIKDISGEKLDKFIKIAKDYVERMEGILILLQRRRKEEIIKRNYEVMIKAAITGLKIINKLPKNPKELPIAIKKYLIEEEKVNPFYENVLKKVSSMRRMVDENLVDKIPEREVELMREYVRRFVREIGEVAKKESEKTKSEL
ncbi:MAG: nucleotidyltransferase domain-containing protein [Candidatus Aenigmarchaeota archaeon]|nr:nucleotidyltransferase domain-containing protein [Candidatus Aenigmarchaeota archaeon]